MTTETQPQAQPEAQDGENINIWRVIGRIEANQQTMLQRFDQQDARMDRQDARMDRMEQAMLQRFDQQDARIDRLEARMDRLEAKMDRLMYFMIGVTVVNVGALIAALAN